MATKAEIKALQDANLASGSNIPASRHRAVLNTDENSILENMYPNVITDVSDGTKTITSSNANFNYTVNVSKIGRRVNLSGTFSPIGNQSAFQQVFAFTNTEYNGATTYSVANKIGASDFVEIGVSNGLSVRNFVVSGEIFRFNITYNTLN